MVLLMSAVLRNAETTLPGENGLGVMPDGVDYV